ncbi:MAG TPA: AI-2E family transporter [Burkholderiales bacterium]|nr:AI-2E family transporter [Burkholderiales bacterium]
MDQAERKDTAQHALVYVGIGVSIVVLLVLLWYAIDVFLLLFIGIFIAVLLRSPADWLARHTGWSEGLTLSLVLVVLLAVLAGAGFFFGRTIVDQSWRLTQQLPKLIEKARERLSRTEVGENIAAAAQSPPPEASAQVLGKGLRLIGSTFAALASLVVVLFLGIFLAWQPSAYRNGFVRLFPERRRRRAREVLNAIGAVLERWLVGQLVLMTIVGMLTWIGLHLLGVPFALPLALFAGLAEFVPYIGPIVAAVPAVLVAIGESPELALWTTGLYVLVQSVESYLLTPLIQHRAVYLPPALLLLSQVVLGVTAGPLGVVVATPLAAAGLIAVNKLYVEDVLGDKNSGP